jgi:hypothetical protein
LARAASDIGRARPKRRVDQWRSRAGQGTLNAGHDTDVRAGDHPASAAMPSRAAAMNQRATGTAGLGPAFDRALAYAAALTREQTRKGTDIPYIAHLLAVAAIVIEDGGSEDEAIAALLHDAAEDHGGHARLEDIRQHFGVAVADIVEACSDSLVEDPRRKAPFHERKRAYLTRLRTASLAARRVSAADKLHNARAILADYRVLGEALWSRFNPDAGRDGVLWYYRALVTLFCTTGPARLADELARAVGEIHRLAGAPWPGARSAGKRR